MLLRICQIGLEGRDPLVKQTAVSQLGRLSNTSQKVVALEMLLPFVKSDVWQMRSRVANVLRKFDSLPEAQEALSQLRQDPDYRVVAAILEGCL